MLNAVSAAFVKFDMLRESLKSAYSKRVSFFVGRLCGDPFDDPSM